MSIKKHGSVGGTGVMYQRFIGRLIERRPHDVFSLTASYAEGAALEVMNLEGDTIRELIVWSCDYARFSMIFVITELCCCFLLYFLNQASTRSNN